MGSLLRGETFPEEKRNAFLYAFSKIPQRVLWKWEGDVLPGKSDNIMISKWMPQRDILGKILSFTEILGKIKKLGVVDYFIELLQKKSSNDSKTQE